MTFTLGVPITPVPFTAVVTPPQPEVTPIWTATGLPAGLTLSSTGVLAGTPTDFGFFSFRLRVTLQPGGCFHEQVYAVAIANSCGQANFSLLLETGSYLLQEDGVSRLQLELATFPGVSVCGLVIPAGTQLFPPSITQRAPTPAQRVCMKPSEAEPALVPVRRSRHLYPPAVAAPAPPRVHPVHRRSQPLTVPVPPVRWRIR